MHDSDSAGSPAMEMPRYVSHKRVWALEIESVGLMDHPNLHRTVASRDKGYAPSAIPEEVFLRYKPVPGDFYVVYADGYKSFSPRKAFLEGYQPVCTGAIGG